MRIILLAVVTLCLAATVVWYPENPPVAHTGGFGEPTCHACHFDGDVNDGVGDLTVLGLEAGYEPGETYSLSVLLVRRNMPRAGFQLSVRSKEGNQAGVLKATDERVGIDRAGGIEYIRHSSAGTGGIVSDSALWTFDWTAPDSIASIVLHVTANAANDDESEFGDAVYQKQLLIKASQNNEVIHRR